MSDAQSQVNYLTPKQCIGLLARVAALSTLELLEEQKNHKIFSKSMRKVHSVFRKLGPLVH